MAEDVLAKGDLLLDQGAAILTRQKERLAAIEVKERTVDAAHADSLFEVARLNAELDGVDLDAFAAAEVSVSARAELVGPLVDLRRVKGEIEHLRERENAIQRDLDGLDGAKWRRDHKRLLAHPHCVALSRQYRYPSIIADIVNRFCYDGLLESEKVSSPSDSSTVIFVDTSGMDEYDLVRHGDSWWSPGGIELMVALARLIGNGRYVRASNRPGMMALASLQGEPNFQVVPAVDLLNGDISAG